MLYTAVAVAALLLFIWGGWRLASRRRSLPCPVWLRWLVELDNPFARTARAATIIDHLDLRPGMTVADIGCGPGRVTIPAAQRVGDSGEVVALDIQAGMLERARDKAVGAGLTNIKFLLAGAGAGQLGKSRFDRALLVTVLGEIPNREVAIKEIFDALKPGGVLSVTEIVFDPHFQSRQTVSRLARTAGFREQAHFGNRLAYTLNLQKPAA
jgi:ubiquinone/menaquinone biosynthesis C-methylase UbiE